MLLNKFMPVYDFHEIHKIRIQARPETVFRAIQELTPAELSPLVFLLMDIRSLPARLFKRGEKVVTPPGPFLEQMVRGGFIPLAEEPGREIVFGLIGQFWKADAVMAPRIDGPASFMAFDEKSFAKVAANLYIQEENGSVRCSTETRIHAAEASTRRKFAFYWRIISMGSAIIRILWLRAIKRKAENMG